MHYNQQAFSHSSSIMTVTLTIRNHLPLLITRGCASMKGRHCEFIAGNNCANSINIYTLDARQNRSILKPTCNLSCELSVFMRDRTTIVQYILINSHIFINTQTHATNSLSFVAARASQHYTIRWQ